MNNARNVLITGGNRGIGLELVRQMLASPAPPRNLFVTARNPTDATDLSRIAKDNPSIHVMQLEVTEETDYAPLVEKVDSIVGNEGLNVLINNAGFIVRSTLESVTKEEMVKQFAVNTLGPLMATKAFLPLLRQAAKTLNESGRAYQRAAVFNIGSIMGSVTENVAGGLYGYRASKAALNMVTVTLHHDLKTEGILCMVMHPGWVQTDMGGPKAAVSPPDSAQGLLKVMSEATIEQGGTFVDFSGKTRPW